MDFGAALAGIGGALGTFKNLQQQDQENAHRQAMQGLVLEQTKMQNAALTDQADERRLRMDEIKRRKAYSDEVADALSKYSLDGAATPGAESAATPAAAIPGATPTPGGGKKATALDAPGYYGQMYRIALKHGMTDQAQQIRGTYLQQQQAAVKQAGERAVAAYSATRDPRVLLQFYNQMVPDGSQVQGTRQNPDGTLSMALSDGREVTAHPDELAKAVYGFADSEGFVKYYGKQLEERAKGDEARKTEAQKSTSAKELQKQKDDAAGKRTEVEAGARTAAAGIGASATKYSADKRLEGVKLGLDGKEGKGNAKPQKEARDEVGRLLKNDAFGAITGDNAKVAEEGAVALAEQYAGEGVPPGEAARRAVAETKKNIAYGGARGAPKGATSAGSVLDRIMKGQ